MNRIYELNRLLENKNKALRRLVGGYGAMVPGDTTEHNLRIPADAIRQSKNSPSARCWNSSLRSCFSVWVDATEKRKILMICICASSSFSRVDKSSSFIGNPPWGWLLGNNHRSRGLGSRPFTGGAA